MESDRIYYLLQRFFDGKCTPKEKDELALWVDVFQDDETWAKQLKEIWTDYEADTQMEDQRAKAILSEIIHKKETVPLIPKRYLRKKKLLRWTAVAAVAALLIALSFVYLLPQHGMQDTNENLVAGKAADTAILPGGNKAVLTLAGGKTIFLDSSHNGLLAANQGNKVIKLSKGVLKLQTNKKTKATQISYNTITTPRGGQYKVILPDGTKVWLNAASSLKFPSVFNSKKREVYVKGEVYAEVAKDENRPFYVHILSKENQNQGLIKVLGTKFNINAYPENEQVKTTLLAGSIKVQKEKQAKILSPGERAFINKHHIAVKQEDDMNRIIAWKNGKFNFEGYDIQHVMQQISRWYDVKVNYAFMPSAHFVGTISRSSNISEVLHILEMTGVVHFKITQRTITVME